MGPMWTGPSRFAPWPRFPRVSRENAGPTGSHLRPRGLSAARVLRRSRPAARGPGRTPEGARGPLTPARARGTPGAGGSAPPGPVAACRGLAGRKRLRGRRRRFRNRGGSRVKQTMSEALCRRPYPGDLFGRWKGSRRPLRLAHPAPHPGRRTRRPPGKGPAKGPWGRPVGRLCGLRALESVGLREGDRRELRSQLPRTRGEGGCRERGPGIAKTGLQGPPGRKERETRPQSAATTAPAAALRGGGKHLPPPTLTQRPAPLPGGPSGSLWSAKPGSSRPSGAPCWGTGWGWGDDPGTRDRGPLPRAERIRRSQGGSLHGGLEFLLLRFQT